MPIVLMRKQMLGQGLVTYDKLPNLDQVWIGRKKKCLTQRQSIEATCPTLITSYQSTTPWSHPSVITICCFFLVLSSLILNTYKYIPKISEYTDFYLLFAFSKIGNRQRLGLKQ